MSRVPPAGRVRFTVNSDYRKSYQAGWQGNWTWDDAGGRSVQHTPSLSLHPSTSILVKFEPTIRISRDMAQYVATMPDSTSDATYGARYVFGTLEQTSISLDTRLNWTFSPKLSLSSTFSPSSSPASTEI